MTPMIRRAALTGIPPVILAAMLALPSGRPFPSLVAILTYALLAGHALRGELSPRMRSGLFLLTCAVVLLFTARAGLIMKGNLANPRDYDFGVFHLDGRVAAAGLNFYDPASFQRIAEGATYDPLFVREILDVGFWYPPPTMLLFLPLAWMAVKPALFVWYLFHGGSLILAGFIVWRVFREEASGGDAPLIAALLLLNWGFLSTLIYAQTNFLVLLFAALFWRDFDRPRAGIWFALGCCVKPIFGVLVLLILLRRKWSAFAAGTATGAAVSLISILVFGSATFFAFFTANVSAHLDADTYIQTLNQSLLSTILRVTHYEFAPGVSPTRHPVYIALALTFTAITAWRIFAVSEDRRNWAFAMALTLALLIYPATLVHYCILLALFALVMWRDRESFPGGAFVAAAVLAAGYGCLSYAQGQLIFPVMLIFWLIAIAMSFTASGSGFAGARAGNLR